MYKLIVNNLVVDVVKKLRYVKYIPELNRVVLTSKASADGVCGSNNKTFYSLAPDNTASRMLKWKTVTIFEIQEKEYKTLSSALKISEFVNIDSYIQHVREKKINEMSAVCRQSIIEGFSCRLSSSNAEKHFSLTIEDQLNLVDIEREINQGASNVIYHSTNNVCELFSSTDMMTIIKEASKHKKYHTTYFNVLKYCINNIEDIDVINNITYGVDIHRLPLPGAVLNNIEKIFITE